MITKVISIIAAWLLLVVGLQYLLRPYAIQRQHLTEQSRHRWAVALNPFSNYRMTPLFIWSVRITGLVAIVMAIVVLWAILTPT
jgi:uncharacterized protein YjeT (DUF2065 family)